MNNFIILNNTNYNKFNQTSFEQNGNDSLIQFNPKFILLILLIVILFLNLNNLKVPTNVNESNYIMGGYSLYNWTYYPQISLLIHNIENWNVNNEQLLNFIDNLKKQKLKDIQIIFLLNNQTENKNLKIIKQQSLKDNRISFYEYGKLEEDNIFEIMNKIKGKFTLMIDKLITFAEELLQKYYNLTKGKINNLFEFKTEKQTLYLIKTKILSELLDYGKFNFNYTELINNIKSSPFPNFNYISIAYCPNNIYTPFAYVSMLSALSSKSTSTYISFYIITSRHFLKTNTMHPMHSSLVLPSDAFCGQFPAYDIPH